MPNTITIKKSALVGNVPSSLAFGELALNYADGKLYYKNSSNSIVSFASSISLGDLSNVTLTSPAANNLLKYNGTKWINDSSTIQDISDLYVLAYMEIT